MSVDKGYANIDGYYYNPGKPKQLHNVHRFAQMMRYDYPQLRCIFPDPTKPWHVQIKMYKPDGAVILLNFWPTQVRGQVGHGKSVRGVPNLRRLIDNALAEYSADVMRHQNEVRGDYDG